MLSRKISWFGRGHYDMEVIFFLIKCYFRIHDSLFSLRKKLLSNEVFRFCFSFNLYKFPSTERAFLLDYFISFSCPINRQSNVSSLNYLPTSINSLLLSLFFPFFLRTSCLEEPVEVKYNF